MSRLFFLCVYGGGGGGDTRPKYIYTDIFFFSGGGAGGGGVVFPKLPVMDTLNKQFGKPADCLCTLQCFWDMLHIVRSILACVRAVR